jgi:hypothetical protein
MKKVGANKWHGRNKPYLPIRFYFGFAYDDIKPWALLIIDHRMGRGGSGRNILTGN